MAKPRQLPEWFWVWVRWRRGHGEFKKYGPANQAVRPKFKGKIPKWAWGRLKRNSKPIRNLNTKLGVFAYNGGFVVRPNHGAGPIEVLKDMKANKFEWITLQVFEGSEEGKRLFFDWRIWRAEADKRDIEVIPWARCRNISDVELLVRMAREWGCLCLIVNLEDEAWNGELPPREVVEYLKSHWSGGDVGVSTVGYPPKGYGWEAFNEIRSVGLMQVFRNEIDRLTPSVCFNRGHEIGFDNVALTLGTYKVRGVQPSPALYSEWDGKPRSLYIIENNAIDISEWA